MIGLDTNVILRHLLQDDRVQSAKATRFIEERLTIANPGYISIVAMAETAWVLESIYELGRLDIVRAIESMLQTEVFAVEHESEVFEAMVALEDGVGSFPDALIGALGKSAGCSHTVTFDRRAARLASFKSI